MDRRSRSSVARWGAVVAASLPVALAIMMLLRGGAGAHDRCTWAVSTPILVAGMAVPTYLAGRGAAHGGTPRAVAWMVVAAVAAYLVLGASWTVWGLAADRICRVW